jgi:CHAD domain-containing protein
MDRVHALDRFGDRLIRRQAMLSSIVARLARGRSTVGQLHDDHRELRRLRADLRLSLALVSSRFAEMYEGFDHQLDTLAHAIGKVRDRDVGQRLVAKLIAKPLAASCGADLEELAEALAGAAHIGRQRLSKLAHKPAIAQMTKTSWQLRQALRGVEESRLRSQMRAEQNVRISRVSRRLERALERPTIRRLHRLRMALRDLRSLDQACSAIFATVGGFGPDLKELQLSLGRLHDWDLLLKASEQMLEGVGREEIRRLLRKRVRAARRRARKAIARDSVTEALVLVRLPRKFRSRKYRGTQSSLSRLDAAKSVVTRSEPPLRSAHPMEKMQNRLHVL